jgi:hypothetical protein
MVRGTTVAMFLLIKIKNDQTPTQGGSPIHKDIFLSLTPRPNKKSASFYHPKSSKRELSYKKNCFLKEQNTLSDLLVKIPAL